MARQKLDRRDGQGSAGDAPILMATQERQQHEPHAAEQPHHPIVRPGVRQANRAYGSIRAHGSIALMVIR